VVFSEGVSEDNDIVHIDKDFALSDEVMEYMVSS